MKGLEKYIPAFLYTLLAVVVIYAMYKGKKWFDHLTDTTDSADRDPEVADPDSKRLSYPLINYTNWANRIEVALEQLYNDDENSVYAVFNQMNNNDDVLQLQKSFGTRKNSPWGVGTFGGYTGTLSEWLQASMSQREIDNINMILEDNGITIRF